MATPPRRTRRHRPRTRRSIRRPARQDDRRWRARDVRRPAKAIRCSLGLREQLNGIDVHIRCGIHAGEVEGRGDDVGGIAVHIAARVMGEAEPVEILASSTVKDLVVGSSTKFSDRGTHVLKGVPDEWRLYAVESV